MFYGGLCCLGVKEVSPTSVAQIIGLLDPVRFVLW